MKLEDFLQIRPSAKLAEASLKPVLRFFYREQYERERLAVLRAFAQLRHEAGTMTPGLQDALETVMQPFQEIALNLYGQQQEQEEA